MSKAESKPLPFRITLGPAEVEVEVPAEIRKMFEEAKGKISTITHFNGLVGIEKDKIVWTLNTFDHDDNGITRHDFHDRNTYKAVAKFFQEKGYLL